MSKEKSNLDTEIDASEAQIEDVPSPPPPPLSAPVPNVSAGLELLSSVETLLFQQVIDLYYDSNNDNDWPGKCKAKYLVLNRCTGGFKDEGTNDPNSYQQQLFFAYHTNERSHNNVFHVTHNRRDVLCIEMDGRRCCCCCDMIQCCGIPTHIVDTDGKRLGCVHDDFSISDENGEKVFQISQPFGVLGTKPFCGCGDREKGGVCPVLDVKSKAKVAYIKHVQRGEDSFVFEDGKFLTLGFTSSLNAKQKALLIGGVFHIVFIFYKSIPVHVTNNVRIPEKNKENSILATEVDAPEGRIEAVPHPPLSAAVPSASEENSPFGTEVDASDVQIEAASHPALTLTASVPSVSKESSVSKLDTEVDAHVGQIEAVSNPPLSAPVPNVDLGLDVLSSVDTLLFHQVRDVYYDSNKGWPGKCQEKYLILNMTAGGFQVECRLKDINSYPQLFFAYHTNERSHNYVSHVTQSRRDVLRIEMDGRRCYRCCCCGMCQCCSSISPTYVVDADGKRLGCVHDDFSISDENDEKVFQIFHSLCVGIEPYCGCGDKDKRGLFPVVDVKSKEKVAEMKDVQRGDGQLLTLSFTSSLSVTQKALLIGGLFQIVFVFYKHAHADKVKIPKKKRNHEQFFALELLLPRATQA